MRTISLLAVVMVVFGCCDQALAESVGRWQIVPIIGPPMDVRGTPHYYAWRIDTVTGVVQMCAYDPGGWKRADAPGGIVRETLECTTQIAAPEANNASGMASK
jgi:hypothetical protein